MSLRDRPCCPSRAPIKIAAHLLEQTWPPGGIRRCFGNAGGQDWPVTITALRKTVHFFAGVNRHHRTTLTPEQLRQPVEEVSPYPSLFREQINFFVNWLESEGYLIQATRRKHILTGNELDQVVAALWQIPLPAIARLSLGFIVAIEEQTGIRPGEWSRYTWAGEGDTSNPDERTSPFCWREVQLFFEDLETVVV